MKKSLSAVLSGIASIIAVADGATAQNLRRAVAAADLVLVARSIRVVQTKTHVIHRLSVEEVLRAPQGFDPSRQISVVVTKRVATHNRPLAAKRMLYCIHVNTLVAVAAKLPQGMAPYYKMSGYAGSAVVLDDSDRTDPRLAFARILVASQKGQSSRKTADQVFAIALTGDPRVRTEATLSLSERPALLSCLSDLHLSKVLARAIGETRDIRYKIELAAICASRRLPGMIPSLCLSTEHVGDISFLQALGRHARFIHGDQAHRILTEQVNRARGRTRDRLIVTLGATSTEGALEVLLKMQKLGQNKDAVEAALRIHGSPRGRAAISRKDADRKREENGKKDQRRP